MARHHPVIRLRLRFRELVLGTKRRRLGLKFQVVGVEKRVVHASSYTSHAPYWDKSVQGSTPKLNPTQHSDPAFFRGYRGQMAALHPFQHIHRRPAWRAPLNASSCTVSTTNRRRPTRSQPLAAKTRLSASDSRQGEWVRPGRPEGVAFVSSKQTSAFQEQQ